MDPIVTYLREHPEVWAPYLIPVILAALAAAVRWLTQSGAVGHAVAEIVEGFGLDAKKVSRGLSLLFTVLFKRPVEIPEDAPTDPKGDAK